MQVLFVARTAPAGRIAFARAQGWAVDSATPDNVFASRSRPDVLVVDTGPGMSQAWGALRRHPAWGIIPVVLVTRGLWSLGMLWHAWSYGDELIFVHHLAPPAEFISAVEQAVRSSTRPWRGITRTATIWSLLVGLCGVLIIYSLFSLVAGTWALSQSARLTGLIGPFVGLAMFAPLVIHVRLRGRRTPILLELFVLLWACQFLIGLLRWI